VADGLVDRHFADLPELLAPGDLVVVNRTRVRRARLLGHKEGSGGRVEALLLRPAADGWEALVRPARRLRPGSRLSFGGIRATVLAGPDEGQALLALDSGEVPLEEALERWGEMPLPPYFTGRLADPERYQTVYAARPGSAAAPTAGLHFTPAVLGRLGERGIEVASVDLGIGVDTFRPIAAASLEEHRMHREDYLVDEAAAGRWPRCGAGAGGWWRWGPPWCAPWRAPLQRAGRSGPGRGPPICSSTPATPSGWWTCW